MMLSTRAGSKYTSNYFCKRTILIILRYDQSVELAIQINQIKSSLYSLFSPKRVTSGGAHLRRLTPGQHSFEEMSQRGRAVGDSVPT